MGKFSLAKILWDLLVWGFVVWMPLLQILLLSNLSLYHCCTSAAAAVEQTASVAVI